MNKLIYSIMILIVISISGVFLVLMLTGNKSQLSCGNLNNPTKMFGMKNDFSDITRHLKCSGPKFVG